MNLFFNYLVLLLSSVLFFQAASIIFPLWRCKLTIIPAKIICISFFAIVNSLWMVVIEYDWITNHFGYLLDGNYDFQLAVQECFELVWQIVVMRMLTGFVKYGCDWKHKGE